jgi:CheY-like chemotaxis protein
VFTVSLAPVSDTALSKRKEMPDAETQRAKKLRILVVDDEPLFLDALTILLGKLGHTVVAAEDGETAVELFKEQEFSLVLLDLGMPRLNGYRTAEVMKRMHPRVPIILVTGWGSITSEEELRRIGIARAIAKPFKIDQLVQAIIEVAPDR